MKNKVIIIAEAGVNHNGNFDTAKKLILEAANAGADYVKFQTFKADNLVSRIAEKAEYQKEKLNQAEDTQYEMLKKLEMSEDWHFELYKFAKECGIKFLSTGFDEASIDFLDTLNIDFYKIPSGEITNKPYLEHIAKKKKPIIISTGMSTIDEIGDALNVLYENNVSKDDIIILHCNTEYPTPMSDVNLLAMNFIREKYGLKVGYSDHTLGIEVPIAAVALGAIVIEKHFTLDKQMDGPDHKASLEPSELLRMVNAIRNIELAITGPGEKIVTDSEKKNIVVARKSIHLRNDLSAGQKIKLTDLIMKRPGDGISPMKINLVIGKTVSVDLQKNHKLELKDLQN